MAADAPAPVFDPDDVVVALGTRPEAIKLFGLVKALGPRARLVHTGQHYDPAMWSDVIADLPGLDVHDHVAVGGLSRGEQIGEATTALTRHLRDHPARALVVQGDTNSTLAGALAANSVGVPVVHIEAGLRSHDRSMPEEINRILVDAVADLCCAPTGANAARLAAEGVAADRVLVTGNTLAEALDELLPDAAGVEEVLAQHGVRSGAYVLATIHRAANVDDPATLAALLSALHELAGRTAVLLPVHPRLRARAERHGLTRLLDGVLVVGPMTPRQFVAVESRARLILSDSGGVQEEAALLRRPLLVLRNSTERPELLDGWCRLLGGDDPVEAAAAAYDDAPDWAAILRDRPPAYDGGCPSPGILAEIDRRWPVASGTA